MLPSFSSASSRRSATSRQAIDQTSTAPAGRPADAAPSARRARTRVTSAARVGAPPTLATPLCPAPIPRMVRPPAARSTEAAAEAVIDGWRVTRLVTHVASRTREVAAAARVMATHGSSALPGVSAMPTRSKPSSSPRRAMRAVYSGVYGQKKKPTRIGGLRLGRGILARVGRALEELLRLVGPELRDGRVGVDHGGGELAADLVHPQHVDVLGRVAPVVELDRPARVRGGLDR